MLFIRYYSTYRTINCLLIIGLLLSFISISDSYAYDINHNGKDRFLSAFEKVMNNPADLETTLEYAKIAKDANDYEAAITAYERILFFNPDLLETKLELGILYYKLDSKSVAKSYLNDVIKNDNSSIEIVTEAKKYLGRM